MTAKERDAWERGVSECAALLAQHEPDRGARDRIMSLALGMLHGTMGPGVEYQRKREARTLGVSVQ